MLAFGDYEFDGDVRFRSLMSAGPSVDSADFPLAQGIISKNDTGVTSTVNIGLVSEIQAQTDVDGIALWGIGRTNETKRGIGVQGQGFAADPDTGVAIGGSFSASSSRTAGTNVGIFTSASGAPTNYALRILGGDIDTSLGSGLDWDLPAASEALSFDAPSMAGLLVLDTTGGSEQVRVGEGASSANYPNARTVISHGVAPLSTSSDRIGLVSETSALDGSSVGVGVMGRGAVDGSFSGIGVQAAAVVPTSTDSGTAYGLHANALASHSGGDNVAARFNAAQGVNNWAIQINNGDISTLNAVDWDLLENSGEALSFETPSHSGLLVLDTTTGLEMVRVGASAASADLVSGSARLFVSQADTGITWAQFHTAILAEAVADGSNQGYGVVSTGYANDGGFRGIGVVGTGVGVDPFTAIAAGGSFSSSSTRTAGQNVGVILSATNSSIANYALRIVGGDIDSSFPGTAVDWDLMANNSEALSFDSASYSGMLVFDTQNGGVRMNHDVFMENLPTSDPVVAGQLWNDSGTIKVSAG